jgi:hypothetical protein
MNDLVCMRSILWHSALAWHALLIRKNPRSLASLDPGLCETIPADSNHTIESACRLPSAGNPHAGAHIQGGRVASRNLTRDTGINARSLVTREARHLFRRHGWSTRRKPHRLQPAVTRLTRSRGQLFVRSAMTALPAGPEPINQQTVVDDLCCVIAAVLSRGEESEFGLKSKHAELSRASERVARRQLRQRTTGCS